MGAKEHDACTSWHNMLPPSQVLESVDTVVSFPLAILLCCAVTGPAHLVALSQVQRDVRLRVGRRHLHR